MSRLVSAQQILCARAVSEEDCEQAQSLLEELATPVEAGGFGYYPALLTLASLYETGFEPAIQQDGSKAARYYLKLLELEVSESKLSVELLEEAATQICSLIKDGKASLAKDEAKRLEVIADGAGSAKTSKSIAAWARFAAVEAQKQLREANESLEVREQRKAREAARAAARAEQLERQKLAVKEALASAEELRLQGNDATRQGQLPGNKGSNMYLSRAIEFYAEATGVLSTCLGSGLHMVPDEAAEVRRQRALLYSNAAQVQLSDQNWSEACRLSELALEDSPGAHKPTYRLARAQVGLKDWPAAANTVDKALASLRGQSTKDIEDTVQELWKLAEEISRALPDFKWSSAKPSAKNVEDFEKRLVGFWTYGGGTFEIRLEQWGALVFHEEPVKVDLMRKSKLRWRGEVEMISGMVLNISYEPGSDVVITEFVPPPDIPAQDQWQGPKTFTAHRAKQPEKRVQKEEETSEIPEPLIGASFCYPSHLLPKDDEPEAVKVVDPSSPEGIAAALEGVPEEIWLTGHDELAGRYKLIPDKVENGKPVYQQSDVGDGQSQKHFLWFRGGNWGITATLHASSFAAPFLVRSADQTGSRHPLELRRPRWQVRCGRQEQLDPAIKLLASRPEDASGMPGTPNDTPVTATEVPVCSTASMDNSASKVPPAVVLRGRTGPYSEANGRYELTRSTWSGRPVYLQPDKDEVGQANPLNLFFDHGYWVLAEEVTSMPRTIARRRCDADSPHPAAKSSSSASRPWEFLQGEVNFGHMVKAETRTYGHDRAVVLEVADGEGSTAVRAASPSLAEDLAAAVPPSPLASPSAGSIAGSLPFKPKERTVPGEPSDERPCAQSRPNWVTEASAEVCGAEVKVLISCRAGVAINLASLDIRVSTQSLQVTLASQEDQTLELQLPLAVDADSNPVARWSEKTRTLRVRLPVFPS
eukprot:TRINITY_DN20591_c1_g1_i2.p1 TRINITY_DN20591_c1_g1~~TRINITY_DN20591_c1_g1_i2.p1  ORF type:complete len:964 (+),score=232.40 TRINITY_DN20591_c1_g1_i2:96-2894(+)